MRSIKIELESSEKYRNKNTKLTYIMMREIMDATNSREGKTVILYIHPETLHMYVRDTDEFLEKFEKIGE